MNSGAEFIRSALSKAVIVSSTLLILSGCGTTEQQVKTIVRDAAIEGPIFSPPVHVVSDNAKYCVTVSAHATVQQMSLLSGMIEGSEPSKSGWLYPVDTMRLPGGGVSLRRQIPQYNLSWQRPDVSAGLHVDVAWGSTALSFGGSLAESRGSTLLGWSAGLGFFSRETSNFRMRLDIGVFGQTLDYDARSVTITTTTSTWLFGGQTTTIDTAFYHDTKSESSIGYYGSLTFNSANPAWPVNFFLQGNLIAQPILSYTPYTRTTVDWLLFFPVESTSGRGKVSMKAVFLGVTPGIYIEPSRSMVLTAGVRCLFDISETFGETHSVIIPFVQVGLRTGF